MLVFYLGLLDSESEKSRFTELYQAHYKLMFAVAFEKSHNYQAAEDIVHNAFLRILKVLRDGRLDDKRNVEGYFATITANEAKKYWIKQQYEEVKEDETLFSFLPKVDYTVNTVELEQLIRQVIQLDVKYKEPLKLYTNGYPLREIAAILDLTETNVKQRLRRGRLMLLQTLEEK